MVRGKNELLDEAKNTLQILMSAVDAIRSGESESSVISRLGIKKGVFRRFVLSGGANVLEEKKSDDKSLKEQDESKLLFNGGERLYVALRGESAEVPYDADKTAEWVLSHTNLSERALEAVRARFYECLTWDEIGERIGEKYEAGSSGENTRRLVVNSLRKMRRECRDVLHAGTCCLEAVENVRLEKHLAKLEELQERNEEVRTKIAEIEEKEKAASGKNTVELDPCCMTVGDFVEKRVRGDGVPMSVRTYNCIARGRIMSPGGSFVSKYLSELKVYELNGMPLREIARIRNLGEKGLKELQEFFANEGIYFADKDGNKIVPEGAVEVKEAEHER